MTQIDWMYLSVEYGSYLESLAVLLERIQYINESIRQVLSDMKLNRILCIICNQDRTRKHMLHNESTEKCVDPIWKSSSHPSCRPTSTRIDTVFTFRVTKNISSVDVVTDYSRASDMLDWAYVVLYWSDGWYLVDDRVGWGSEHKISSRVFDTYPSGALWTVTPPDTPHDWHTRQSTIINDLEWEGVIRMDGQFLGEDSTLSRKSRWQPKNIARIGKMGCTTRPPKTRIQIPNDFNLDWFAQRTRTIITHKFHRIPLHDTRALPCLRSESTINLCDITKTFFLVMWIWAKIVDEKVIMTLQTRKKKSREEWFEYTFRSEARRFWRMSTIMNVNSRNCVFQAWKHIYLIKLSDCQKSLELLPSKYPARSFHI